MAPCWAVSYWLHSGASLKEDALCWEDQETNYKDLVESHTYVFSCLFQVGRKEQEQCEVEAAGTQGPVLQSGL